MGSIAHDCAMAVAAVTRRSANVSLGIDVEPAKALPDDIASVALTPNDVIGAARDRDLAGRIVFAAKEAIYKATFPLDGTILGHEDVAVDLTAARGRTRTGHVLALHYCVAPRIVVLAIAAVQ